MRIVKGVGLKDVAINYGTMAIKGEPRVNGSSCIIMTENNSTFSNYAKDNYSTELKYNSMTGLTTSKGLFRQSFIDSQIVLNEPR